MIIASWRVGDNAMEGRGTVSCETGVRDVDI